MDFLVILILLVISIIDIKTKTIDTRLNIVLLIIGIFTKFSIKEILFCMCLPISLLIINFLYKKEMIGYGDIELIACISMYLGYQKEIISFFIATILLAIYSMIYKKEKMAFGPFISLGIIITMIIYWRC